MDVQRCESSIKAQVPTVCEICEETTSVKYKCIQCGFFLCERCRKFHEKVKTQEAHDIVDIREKKPMHAKINRIQLKPCRLHEDEKCILYCVDCKELVCANCVSTGHQKHSLKNAKSLVSDKMEMIEKFEKRIDESILPNITRKQKRLENMIAFHKQTSEKAKSKICKWEQYLRENITKVLETQRTDLIQSLEKSADEIKESVLPEISKLEELRQEIEKIRKILEESSKESNLEKELITTPIEAKMSEVMAYKINVRTQFPKFDQNQMGPMPLLGELLFKEVFQIKHLHSFSTGLTCVDKIIVEKTGTLLIRNLETKTIKQIKIDDGKFTQLHKWEIDVKDMASLESGEIIFILADKTEVRILRLDKEQTYDLTDINISKIFYDPAPQIPTAVHASRDNKVVVTTIEPERDVLPMDEQCKVQIFVLNLNGDLISRFDFDKNLFCFPDKVSSMNGLTCVSDSISDYSGRVVTLDETGEVKWMYGDINSSLIVSDMAYTNLCNIILLQVCQGTLIVLDSEGVCLHSWNLEDMGITHAYSLTIDNDDHILIGCGVNGNNFHILEFIES